MHRQPTEIHARVHSDSIGNSNDFELADLSQIPPGAYRDTIADQGDNGHWQSKSNADAHGIQGTTQAHPGSYSHIENAVQATEAQEYDTSGILTEVPVTRVYQTMLLMSGFFMCFLVIGTNSCYGIFQEYYTSPQSNIIDGPGNDALVALVGTIGSGLTWSGSIFVNPLIARTENIKIITVSGAVLMSLGTILASFCTKLWQLYLTQSILYGVGASLFYFPIMSLSPRFFDRHRGFAMGFILAGSGIGGLVIAPVLHVLISTQGIQWALRILGLAILVMAVPVACVVKQPPGFEGRRSGTTRVSMRVVKQGTFIAQSLGAFLQASGNLVPVYYMPSFSTSVLAYSTSTGSLFLAINNAVNSASRIGMGILADRVGRQNTLITSVILSGISVFALWYNAMRPQFIAFVVMYGIYAGGYNALLPTTITEVYGIQNYNSVNGFIYFIRGLGALLGAPIAGAILGSQSRSGPPLTMDDLFESDGPLRKRYNNLVVFDGMLLMGASVCVLYVRWLDARQKGVWKWMA